MAAGRRRRCAAPPSSTRYLQDCYTHVLDNQYAAHLESFGMVSAMYRRFTPRAPPNPISIRPVSTIQNASYVNACNVITLQHVCGRPRQLGKTLRRPCAPLSRHRSDVGACMIAVLTRFAARVCILWPRNRSSVGACAAMCERPCSGASHLLNLSLNAHHSVQEVTQYQHPAAQEQRSPE